MGITNFPNGVNAGDASGNASNLQVGGTTLYPVNNAAGVHGLKVVAGTILVPSGANGTQFVPAGLTTATYVVASPYAPIAGTGFVTVCGSVAGGSVTLIGIAEAGTVSASNGTATYIAYGT